MAPPKKNRVCSVEGCDRKHAAEGYCLMHYKRVKKHGSPDYMWGGKVVGRKCLYCDRAIMARDMCSRHYQMWRKHGDPLYSDKLKKGGLLNGTHLINGYRALTHVCDYSNSVPAGATVEKTDKHHRKGINKQGYRNTGAGRKCVLEHRVVAGAKPGEIVHHIDGDKLNNHRSNLHVFESNSMHTKAHKSLEAVGYALISLGMVYFDKTEGVYKLRLSCDLSSA